MKLSKILIAIVLIFFLIFFIRAETTFFDNPNDFFVIGNSNIQTVGVISPITEETTSGGGKICPFGYKLENGTCIKNISKLFDIKLILDSAIINNSDELSSTTIFENFGNVPTSVDLTYRILNSFGKEVYNKKENVTVFTAMITSDNFKNLNLPEGKYTLILTTIYGDNITDDFRQSFEIRKNNNLILVNIVGIAIIVLGIISVIFYKIFKNKKIKHKRKVGSF
jgi:hypothetical protein